MTNNFGAIGIVLLIMQTTFVAKSQDVKTKDKNDTYAQQRSRFESEVKYWRSFDTFLNDRKRQLKFAKGSLLAKISKDLEEVDRKERENAITELQSAADEYRKTLNSELTKVLADQTQLGLAQTLFLLATLIEPKKSKQELLTEAQSLAADHSEKYPKSPNSALALVILARIAEALDQKTKAREIYAKVSAIEVNQYDDAYVYAHLNMGDSAFANEDAIGAMNYYEQALAHLEKYGDSKLAKIQQIDTQFRLAWSSYRAAKLEQAIGYARQVATAPRIYSDDDQLEKMQLDAAEILGNSLFELNNDSITAEYLRMKSLLQSAPKISTTIVKRLIDAQLFEEALTFINLAMGKFPISSELPMWLLAKVDLADKLIKTDERLDAQERFVLISMNSSPWRSKNAKIMGSLQSILDLAPKVGMDFIGASIERGIKNRNNADLNRVSAIASSLLHDYPHHQLASTWMVSRVKALYYLERYAESCNLADKMLKERKLDLTTLDDVLYHRTTCSERQWLQLFSSNVNASGKATSYQKDQLDLAAKDMRSAAGTYADRFPGQSRARDLLLLVASDLRDQGDLKEARILWERVLLGKTSAAQRATSIRGIVYAAVEEGDAKVIVDLAERFLKLEDWRELGSPLRNELLGVLATSTIDAGATFAKNGQMLDAGSRMLRSAELVTDLPQRDKIYRDGAYMLAVAGEWDSAMNAADRYLSDTKKKNYRGDLMYLRGRSLEFQMKFTESAKQYLEFAKAYPQSTKAQASLQRAEQLASADDEFGIAADAALHLNREAKLKHVKLAAIRRAVDYFIKGNETDAAITAAAEYRTLEGGPIGVVEEQLLVAKAYVAAGLWNRAEVAIKKASGGSLASNPQTEKSRLRGLSADIALIHLDIMVAQFQQILADAAREDLSLLNTKFADLERLANIAISTRIPRIVSEARYKAGAIAEHFADELAKISTETPFLTQVEKMRMVAKRYHSDNALARMQEPSQYRDDRWSQLSTLKASSGIRNSKSVEYSRDQSILSNDVPIHWSL